MPTIIAFVLVFVPIVLIHELGHFVTAKVAGVRVLEFGIGYPPRLFAFKFKGTYYSFNLFPVGGFVKLLGEENPEEAINIPGEEAPSGRGNLARRSIPVRSLVIGAGALMNILLPVALFATTYMVPQSTSEGYVQVSKVAPNSPAERAGIQPKDIVLEVNGQPVYNTEDLSYDIQLRLGAPTTMLIQRSGEQLLVTATPRWNPPANEGPTGIQVALAGAHRVTLAYPIWQAIPMGVRKTWEVLVLTKNEITKWMLGIAAPQLAGPIGIYQITGEVAKAGVVSLVDFAALLSINLGIMNILPIPMLDGGRLLFLAIEVIRGGRRVSPEREGMVHLVGFVVMIGLLVVVSFFDVERLMRGESFLR